MAIYFHFVLFVSSVSFNEFQDHDKRISVFILFRQRHVSSISSICFLFFFLDADEMRWLESWMRATDEEGEGGVVIGPSRKRRQTDGDYYDYYEGMTHTHTHTHTHK